MVGKRFLLVLLFFCVLVQATVSENSAADDLYQKAVECLQLGDYGGALSYAKNASAAYSRADDRSGVEKCAELIRSIPESSHGGAMEDGVTTTRLTDGSSRPDSLEEFSPYRSHNFLIGAVAIVLAFGSFFFLHRVK